MSEQCRACGETHGEDGDRLRADVAKAVAAATRQAMHGDAEAAMQTMSEMVAEYHTTGAYLGCVGLSIAVAALAGWDRPDDDRFWGFALTDPWSGRDIAPEELPPRLRDTVVAATRYAMAVANEDREQVRALFDAAHSGERVTQLVVGLLRLIAEYGADSSPASLN